MIVGIVGNTHFFEEMFDRELERFYDCPWILGWWALPTLRSMGVELVGWALLMIVNLELLMGD
jgi:hypothetical protein